MPLPKGYKFTIENHKSRTAFIVRQKLMTPAQFWAYIAKLIK